MKTSDFDYILPPELIAQTPIEPRDASRLMVLHRSTGKIVHRTFHDILKFLRPGDLLVGNDSRTIPARLHGAKPTGGTVEVFLLRPHLTPLDPSPDPMLPDQERGANGGNAWSAARGCGRA